MSKPTDDLAAELHEQVTAEVEARRDLLLDVSHRIWEHPELCFEEHHAHALLCDVLDSEGLDPTRHAYDLDTAFVADAGDSGTCVAVCCEYDALPGIGHACGHNIIAAAGLGAGIAAARVADRAGGRVRILGTPAEEGGGGKVFMLRRGAFEGVDAALMVHPADHDLTSMSTIAIQQLDVEYTGQESHAAAAPQLGRNALDAAVLGYMGVAALRQHIAPEERVHGIFTHGGDAPNIVPAHAATRWFVRSPTMESLEVLKPRVLACLEAGAHAAGCSVEHRWKDPAMADVVDDPWLLERWSVHSTALGRPPLEPSEATAVVGSTDMGNVSHVVPSIHPMIAVAPPGVSIHTPEFAEHARSEAGDRAVIDGAIALARTIVDRWLLTPDGSTGR